VFGMAEGVIARAARQASRGDRTGDPLAAAVHAQRQIRNTVERKLLLGLWHVPQLLATAQAELDPGHFEDGSARALAEAWWRDGVVMPDGDGEAAALARELASAGGEDQDQHAEVMSAIRKLKERQLIRERRSRESQLAGTRDEAQTRRLTREIQEIVNQLSKLST
jgi:hypothetical protein